MKLLACWIVGFGECLGVWLGVASGVRQCLHKRIRPSACLGLCLAVCVLAGIATPAGALPSPLADGLRHCGTETDETKRLACFDALLATLPKIEADQFGMTKDLAIKRDPAIEKRTEEAVLPGTIVALGQAGHGQLVFTLDNRQVWVQAEVEPAKIFVVGDVVHIEHGAMGTLWLAADHGRKTRVKRIG